MIYTVRAFRANLRQAFELAIKEVVFIDRDGVRYMLAKVEDKDES